MNRSRYEFDMLRLSTAAADAEPIAIIGASCRLPGAPDVEAFWRLLLDGRDAVTEIPDDRWNKARLFHPERGQRGKAYTFAAGVLGDVSRFDPAFFGISPREATQMDPQQRLLLELAYEAIEDAGVDAARLAGEQVGVFVGGSSWDYLNLNIGDPSATDAYSMIGATLCSLSNRISYAFDLRGPSFTVDTACSSSLVALHQAAEALRSGQVPMAMVGGVSLLLAPQSFVGFCQASMLSPTGRCHAFDAGADGYVRAEGGGVVILKPLGAALAAGDPIRALLRGTGVNSDGRTTGLSLPNREAQAALLRDVYERFGLEPDDLAYLEAHGTGTPAGDPIEAGALGEVLGQRRRSPLPIGSVKTNIGHLEAGSGMAGLIKAMLVAERGIIPPTLHIRTPNPHIAFDALNLALATEARTLTDEGARLVGVNSFGFGGTNAHAVLEAPERGLGSAPADAEDDKLPPLLLSARSEAALAVLAGAWHDRLAGANGSAAPAAAVRGAAIHRTQLNRRLVVPAGKAADMARALQAFAQGRPSGVATNTAVTGQIAFVFSGNGSQWAGMAADAMSGSPGFQRAMAQVDTALLPWLDWSVADALAAPDEALLRDTRTAQPLLFAVQVALVLALREHGVEPDACMGHSVGEVAAAWACGALDLGEAARVIAARSRAQQERHGIGGMAVLGLDLNTGRAALAGPALGDAGLEIAAHNSGQQLTISGPIEGIARLETEAREHGWRFVRLDLDYAFHSAAMDPIEARLAVDLAGLAPVVSRVPFISTVTGERLAGGALDAGYWWRNVRAPVLFAEAARRMVADGCRVFVEIGPHPVVQAYLSDALRAEEKDGRVVTSLSRRPAKADPIAALAARIHAAGGDIRGGAAFQGQASIGDLPRYPWQREQFWVEPTGEATDFIRAPFEHPLLGMRQSDAATWSRHIGIELQPWLADHVVGGAVVVPAAALIEIALAAARAEHPDAAGLDLLDVEIARALVIEPHRLREVRLRMASAMGEFELASRPRLEDEPWTVHMTGRIAAADVPDAVTAPIADPTPVRTVGSAALYALARGMGLEYGSAFQVVSRIDVIGDDGAIVRLGASADAGAMLLPPTLVDGAMQGLLALAAERLGAGTGVLPWRFGRVRLLRPAGAVPTTAELRITRVGPRSVRADMVLRDAAGAAIATLDECWFVKVAFGRQARPEDLFFHPARTASVVSHGSRAAALDIQHVLPRLAQIDAGIEESRLLADAYVATVAAEVLGGLTEGDMLAPQALMRDGVLAADSRVMLDRLLRWLASDGLARQGSDGSWAIDRDLPSSSAILQTLFFDTPRAVADMALLALAGAALPVILRQGPGAAPALPPALWDQFLHDSPAGAGAATALAEALSALIASRAVDRPLRVLEIGAGRGAFTKRLLRRVAPDALLLVAATDATDLPTLTEAIEASANARAIAWTPGETIEPAGFDIVVGLEAFALGGWSAPELAAVRQALAPGGMVLLAEPAPSRLWQLLRPDAPPLADAARWQTLLEQGGFGGGASQSIPTPLWPIELLTAQRDAVAMADAPMDRAVILFAPPDAAFGDICAETLAGRGVEVLRRDADDFDDELAGWAGGAPITAPIAFIAPPGIGATLPCWLSRIAGLATIAPADRPVVVTLVLRAHAAGDEAAAALMGARRVLANEAPHIALRLVRVAPNLSDDVAAGHVAAELLAPDGEDEVAWTRHGRCVARVRRGLPPDGRRAPEALRLTVERHGLLDSLGWVETHPAAPGAGELAIKVEAAALNFRDVMWAMGLLPDEALLDGFAGPTLGLECAGVVTAVGDDVADFAPGDRVMAFAPASLATHSVTAAHAVMRAPDGMDFAAAATVPVAFLTVAYALGTLAQIGAGETVLIHGGAGGVGLAAIQYAQHKGARVFATAGSPAKRALLRSLGVEAVMDSRSLLFADEVMRLTGGQGVDVVLNSLAGEAMRRSLGLLRPFGRFLELGKRDFYENSAVGLRPMRHNVSYFGIDADQLPLRRPQLAARLFEELGALFASGALRPLPHRVYEFADVEDAFRLMQASGHIGKIVLEPGAALPAAIPAAPAFVADRAGSYVVTGGLDGFGRETARWLARNGARHLALLGRRGGATPGADELLAEFAAIGVDARAYAVDVADEAALGGVLAHIRADQAPIVGVVHAAVAMDDALLAQLDADRFARALRPKLAGAKALDRLTRGDDITLFLLFSSVTTPLGNPGQGNYVAANAAMEALAERRHAEGLPALAVQWGPIGDAGYLVRETQVSELLARQLGGVHLTATEALDTLPALLASGVPVAGTATIRWGALKSRLPLLASSLFADMSGPGAEEGGEIDLAAMLAECTPDEARERVTALLVEEVARIMKLAPERVEAQRPLAELGMDSLMAVELRLAVEQRFGISVPLLALSEGATLIAMAGRIVRGIASPDAADAPDHATQLVERMVQFEGASHAGPADGAEAPAEAGFAAATATSP